MFIGAVVMELLPYNWEWKGISKIYVNLTRSLGDVHHLAWRATHPKWAVYGSADHSRYSEWTPEECNSWCELYCIIEALAEGVGCSRAPGH
jgi:hypothetical protein